MTKRRKTGDERIDMGEKYRHIKGMPLETADFAEHQKEERPRKKSDVPPNPEDQPGAGSHGVVGGTWREDD